MGLLIAFDTATPTASAAVLDLEARRILAFDEVPVETHGRALVPFLRNLLADASADVHQVAAVGCGIGPGSFTGVRVGLATAKGLAFGLDVPLVGVGSLEALAGRVVWPEGRAAVLSCLDARRREVYAGGYVVEARGGSRLSVECWLEPRAASVEGLLEALAGSKGALRGGRGLEEVFVLGTGLERLAGEEEALSRAVGMPVRPRGDLPGWPDARAVAVLAAQALQEGRTDVPDALQPVYLRPSDAEQKFGVHRSPG